MRSFLGIFLISLISFGSTVNKYNLSLNNNDGIRFKRLSLQEAKAEAVKTNKIIFIDAYTSWCGPCKKMAATSFQDPNVSEIYNSKFINLKIDMEKDADGIEIAKMYKVQAYPTLLYIDSDGKLIKSIVGFQTPDRLISVASSIE
jgi:thiol:disulfide interchange protein